MKRYLICTKLYEVRPGKPNYLMNEIKSGSRFNSVHLTPSEKERQHEADVQLKIARDLKDGWVRNGPNPFARYLIVHEWSDGSLEEVA